MFQMECELFLFGKKKVSVILLLDIFYWFLIGYIRSSQIQVYGMRTIL